jgi:5S rRNA maturation endonuclease (ribonuclease M5)
MSKFAALTPAQPTILTLLMPAACPQVYVCDGTRVLRDHVRPELEALPRLGRTLVVLTDPDERGRELRNFLDETLGPEVLHAFIPEKVATSGADTASHEAGNRGIEHVVPRGVQLALQAARGSFPSDRCEFTAAELQERRLVNAWNAASSSSSSSSSSSAGVEAAGSEGEVEEGAALRRRRLCALLGLGRCQGNQLLDMLNRYVTRERFEEALAELAAGTGPAAASGAVAGAAAVQ